MMELLNPKSTEQYVEEYNRANFPSSFMFVEKLTFEEVFYKYREMLCEKDIENLQKLHEAPPTSSSIPEETQK